MRKILVLAISLLMLTLAVGCTTTDEVVKVGLVTDAGTIDDKSFNQSAWEGIEQASEEFGAKAKYLQPKSKTTADYLVEIDNLVSADYNLIVTTGYMFQEAITISQDKYPDVKFILVDAAPDEIKENVQAVIFAEQEAGFIAGIAAALESETGKVGFIGGMEIPPVQKFGWGYIAGVAYANKEYNLNVEVTDYIYEGTFDNVAGGSVLAAGMYDNDVDIIFTAAGGVGIGAISEAKTRVENGDRVYVIGVDRDQYTDGLMENGKSVILTSALKKVDNAAYYGVKEFVEGHFEGGALKILNASNSGIGFPTENPNLKPENYEKAMSAMDVIGDSVQVPESKDDLQAFLKAISIDFSQINY